MSERFIIDNMQWSFSRLNSFYNCPYAWHMQYVDCVEQEDNFFSEYGSFIHEILEMYAKEQLLVFQLSEYYEKHFNTCVTHPAPPNKYVDIRESYYLKGLMFLDNIDLDLDAYEILGVEKKIEFEIDGKRFVGYIDLLLRNKTLGEIICLDHKSASIKFLKSGKVSKKDIGHFEDFKRQLYLYSKAIYEEYGSFPKYLKWNFFKDRKYYTHIFDESEYHASLEWAGQTIKKIEEEALWLPDNTNHFYCHNLCGYRNSACEYKQRY